MLAGRIIKITINSKSRIACISVVTMHVEAKQSSIAVKAMEICAKPLVYRMTFDAIPFKMFSSFPALSVLTHGHAPFGLCPIADMGKALTCKLHCLPTLITVMMLVFFMMKSRVFKIWWATDNLLLSRNKLRWSRHRL